MTQYTNGDTRVFAATGNIIFKCYCIATVVSCKKNETCCKKLLYSNKKEKVKIMQLSVTAAICYNANLLHTYFHKNLKVDH